jgi:hypothetical protein
MPSSDGKNVPEIGNGVASGNRKRRSLRLLARTVTKTISSASLRPIRELGKKRKDYLPRSAWKVRGIFGNVGRRANDHIHARIPVGTSLPRVRLVLDRASEREGGTRCGGVRVE